jgi:Ca-activated chloride channel family protein
LANVGPSAPRDLRRLGSQLAGRGISVTTIGVGDDYNEDLMAGLAEASDANYYYVQDTEKLPEIFAKELGELQSVVVRDVRIEITCPEGVTPLGFIGRSEPFEDKKAVVKLSQFVPGQTRCLFLRCRVKGDERDVAKVTVHYTDELDGGSAQATSGTARIGFTADQTVSDQSLNRAVYAEKELLLTAAAKDEAMAQADAGNYAAAGKILARQNATLNAAGAAAPAGMQSQIHTEMKYLQNFSDQLEAGNYDEVARKTMQAQSYNTRNSK